MLLVHLALVVLVTMLLGQVVDLVPLEPLPLSKRLLSLVSPPLETKLQLLAPRLSRLLVRFISISVYPTWLIIFIRSQYQQQHYQWNRLARLLAFPREGYE